MTQPGIELRYKIIQICCCSLQSDRGGIKAIAIVIGNETNEQSSIPGGGFSHFNSLTFEQGPLPPPLTSYA